VGTQSYSKNKGKTSLRRLRRRWEDNIIKDFNELLNENVDCSGLV
jgi:hypothetical protein